MGLGLSVLLCIAVFAASYTFALEVCLMMFDYWPVWVFSCGVCGFCLENVVSKSGLVSTKKGFFRKRHEMVSNLVEIRLS